MVSTFFNDQHGCRDWEERAIAIASFSDRFGTGADGAVGAAGAAGAAGSELQPIARPATNNIMAIVPVLMGHILHI